MPLLVTTHLDIFPLESSLRDQDDACMSGSVRIVRSMERDAVATIHACDHSMRSVLTTGHNKLFTLMFPSPDGDWTHGPKHDPMERMVSELELSALRFVPTSRFMYHRKNMLFSWFSLDGTRAYFQALGCTVISSKSLVEGNYYTIRSDLIQEGAP